MAGAERSSKVIASIFLCGALACGSAPTANIENEASYCVLDPTARVPSLSEVDNWVKRHLASAATYKGQHARASELQTEVYARSAGFIDLYLASWSSFHAGDFSKAGRSFALARTLVPRYCGMGDDAAECARDFRDEIDRVAALIAQDKLGSGCAAGQRCRRGVEVKESELCDPSCVPAQSEQVFVLPVISWPTKLAIPSVVKAHPKEALRFCELQEADLRRMRNRTPVPEATLAATRAERGALVETLLDWKAGKPNFPITNHDERLLTLALLLELWAVVADNDIAHLERGEDAKADQAEARMQEIAKLGRALALEGAEHSPEPELKLRYLASAVNWYMGEWPEELLEKMRAIVAAAKEDAGP